MAKSANTMPGTRDHNEGHASKSWPAMKKEGEKFKAPVKMGLYSRSNMDSKKPKFEVKNGLKKKPRFEVKRASNRALNMGPYLGK